MRTSLWPRDCDSWLKCQHIRRPCRQSLISWLQISRVPRCWRRLGGNIRRTFVLKTLIANHLHFELVKWGRNGTFPHWQESRALIGSLGEVGTSRSWYLNAMSRLNTQNNYINPGRKGGGKVIVGNGSHIQRIRLMQLCPAPESRARRLPRDWVEEHKAH